MAPHKLDTVKPSFFVSSQIFVIEVSSGYIFLLEAILIFTAIIHEELICPVHLLHEFAFGVIISFELIGVVAMG